MVSTLNIHDLEFDTVDIPTSTDKYWYAIFLNFSVGRYFYFRHVISKLKSTQKSLDVFFNDIASIKGPIDSKTYNDITELLDNFIEHNYNTKRKFGELPIFNNSQKQELNILFKAFLKKSVKTKAVLSKKYYSDKPKVNDSHLVSLVVNSNNVELQKALIK